jgi:hypothetical protein
MVQLAYGYEAAVSAYYLQLMAPPPGPAPVFAMTAMGRLLRSAARLVQLEAFRFDSFREKLRQDLPYELPNPAAFASSPTAVASSRARGRCRAPRQSVERERKG